MNELQDQQSPQDFSPADAVTADCYSARERRWMEFGQRARAVSLQPMLQWLTAARISPDMVTLLAMIAGLAFVPFCILAWPTTALACLMIHVLLDGLDGPLARHQSIASPRGSFTDTFADQLVVTAVAIAWMIHQSTMASTVAGTVFVFVYALVVAMAMVRNALAVPYSWLVRPRFFVYAAITSDLFTGWQFTFPVLVACNLLLTWKMLTGFRALRRSIPGPDNPPSDASVDSPNETNVD